MSVVEWDEEQRWAGIVVLVQLCKGDVVLMVVVIVRDHLMISFARAVTVASRKREAVRTMISTSGSSGTVAGAAVHQYNKHHYIETKRRLKDTYADTVCSQTSALGYTAC